MYIFVILTRVPSVWRIRVCMYECIHTLYSYVYYACFVRDRHWQTSIYVAISAISHILAICRAAVRILHTGCC